jgi:hypothetical protein
MFVDGLSPCKEFSGRTLGPLAQHGLGRLLIAFSFLERLRKGEKQNEVQ